MKARRMLRAGLVGMLFLAGAAQGQILFPTSGNVTAGDTFPFLVTNLNEDTNDPPTKIYLFSEDPDRLAVPSDPITQITLYDPATSNFYYRSWLDGAEGIIAAGLKQVDGLFSPIRVHFVGVQYGIVWSDYADITVVHPTFSYNPAAPALRVGDTVPLVIRRTIDAHATLDFQVQSARPAVLGLGTNAFGLQTNASLNLRFGVFELSRTIYVSGLAMALEAGSTNVTITARVGSYATNVACLVSTNAGLILSPASPAVAAGDALAMTVTRGSVTNVSALTVTLTSDDPAVVGVPTNVVIPQGAQSAVFSAKGLKPGSSFVRATAVGVEPGPDSARQVNVGNPILAFDPDPAVVPDGELRVITVRRPAVEAGGELTVNLVNNAPTLFELSVTNVTIPAGYASTTFALLGLSQGSGTLSARSGGYQTNLAVTISAATNDDDPDGDGIPTAWELVLGSDPYDAYSLDPGLTLNDGEWDSDGEGLSNYEEIIIYGTDPLRRDTDDDGVDDRTEVRDDITSALHPMSSRLYRERSLDLGAVPAGGITLPDPSRFYVRTNGWTVESWVRPQGDGGGRIFSLEGAGAGQSFWVGLEDFRPKAEILSGASVIASAGGIGPEGSIQRLPTNEWSHVAWVWGPQDNSLKIYINGVLLIAQETLVAPDFAAGTGVLARAFTEGHLDDVRFWNYDRSWEEVDYWHNRIYPAPADYVPDPVYGRSLELYYRFDDGGSNTVDFARLNDTNFFIPATATMVATNEAVSLLGHDDEDGDLLPEWWAQVHNLDQYPEYEYGPKFEYFDSTARFLARVSYFRTFRAYTSIGNRTGWAQDSDNMFHEPKDQGLGHDGRYSVFSKYVYLYSTPKSATLEVFTPGMESTVVYVNGELLTPTNDTANTEQSLDVASRLKIGRNMVCVYCVSQYDTWADEARTVPVIIPPPANHYERALGKFDARLTVDGIEHIVRGDTSRNDPRAVWFAQTWSTFWQMMFGQGSAPTRPDKENRFLPGNPDYGLPFDADTDSYNAWYEFLSGTNPRDDDSNNNGIPDSLEDNDEDGLINQDEQERGAHPLLPDTDDDARVDGTEVGAGEDPANAQSPAVSRALALPGGPGDFAEMPAQRRFALESWTVESWVRLDPAEADGGILVQRLVGPTNGVNYELGLGDGVTAPANVPYVRYVSVDGFTVQATGSVALAGGTNWTHVAGTYDGYLRELKLYINGAYTSTAPQALQSPAIYAGGPVVQRIGPGLNGAVDDIRIWSAARTEPEIAAHYDKALQGSEPDLVAYYRADDSTSYSSTGTLIGTSANNGTNGAVLVMPWTWGQLQDYVRGYSGDWWDKWTHAATLRGGADYTADDDGAIPIPPSLRVSLLPPDAVEDGAQWAVQGVGTWNNSGVTVYEDLTPGTNVIIFKSVYGWTAPSNRTVVLSNGVTTVLTETYVRNGSLRVELAFVDLDTHGELWPVTGAQWRVTGGVWKNSGETLDNLTPGNFTIEFRAIPGWEEPAPANVTILAGETTLVLRQYSPATASLRVQIVPPVAVTMGAQWRLDSGAWQSSGTTLTGVGLGAHLVSFSDVPPWVTPAPISLELMATNLVIVTGRYEQVTGIYVEIAPPEAVAAGAQWTVDGSTWHNSTDLIDLAPGNYTVAFRPLTGWGTAPSVPTSVTSGYTTVISATYNPQDPDGDGIPTDWEIYLGSDPYDPYSLDPADVLNDGQWDSDGDELSNYDEIVHYGTDPLRTDTDDDGVWDGQEILADITNPLHPMSSRLYRERSLDLGAVPTNGVMLPDAARFHVSTNGWTVECWLWPETDGDGHVFTLEGAGVGASFRVGLEDHRPKVELLSGTNVIAQAGGIGPDGSIQQLPTNAWTHVAWAWGPQDNSLKIFLNGVLLIAQETLVAPDFLAGTGILARAFTDGYADDIRFWNYDRSWDEVDYWNNRFYPAPAGYVLEPSYGRSLRMHYRFDDGGSNTVDFAFLNQPVYFLPDTAAWISTNPAVSLLGADDEDGDLLPEWWADLHALDQYPVLTNVGPALLYYDESSDPENVARVLFYRAAHVYGSVGGYFSWQDAEDDTWYSPKTDLLGWDGRFSSYLKYVYLYRQPQEALLKIHTPGMVKTVVYVNGERFTAEADETRTEQVIDVASRLHVGRNAIYVYCESSYSKYLDEGRTIATSDPEGAPWWEGLHGKFDAEMECDGQAVIVRGDHTRNDPRAAWYAQTWSTYVDEGSDPPLPDLEMRAVPGNADYGLPFDADSDDFNAWYEYLSGTNPRDDDSNNNGVPDGLEDFDADGLVNAGEQDRGTHPLLPDTDDDVRRDGAEVAAGEDPASARSPSVSRALVFTGTDEDFAEMPMERRFALDSWTLEAYVRLSTNETNGGILVQRAVGPNGLNYELGLSTANVPYVRYVSVDGFTVQATGSVALAGGTNWTHVAGTYDSYTRELMLYTNGLLVGSATQALQPPAVYAGGPVLQRIGAGLNGAVDEVRLWSVARNGPDIEGTRDVVLQGNEDHLVAYYRADDATSYSATGTLVGTSANNITNGPGSVLPWTWGQVQDYGQAYEGDWWDKWTHAASLRGAAAFTADGDGALYIPPSLRVTLLPPMAVDDGAQWAIQGVGSWRDSGVTVYEGLTEGTNTVLFKSIYGWTAPSNRTVVLSNGVTTALTEYYIQNGSLRVEFSFVDEAVHGLEWPVDGARWRIESGAWKTNGETAHNLTPGNYTVEFQAIDGWVTPAALPATVVPGGTTLLLGQYVPAVGSVRVWIEPEIAATNWGAWRVDSGAWHPSGYIQSDIRVGEHTIGFATNGPIWLTPANQVVQITTNLLTITGRYTQVTGIYVEFIPTNAVATGALWRVTGGPWTNADMAIEFAPGDYTVEFIEIPYWADPPDVPTAVTSGFTTVIQAYYWPMQIYGPAGETNASLTLSLTRPRGLAFDALRRLYIADSGQDRIVVLDTRITNLPAAVSTIGAAGTGSGQFNQPFGVTVDPATNVYVADTGNNRVQRRTPAGAWTVWGGTSPGSAVGQFNAPYDLDVDTFTNLYVTDRSNYRVQKRTPANLWSVLVSNGVEDAFVRLAKGVTVGASNYIVVSDYDAGTAYTRIQGFTTNGTFLGRIGSSTNTEGGLNRAQRMAFGRTNDLFVADMNNNRIVRRIDPGAWSTVLAGNIVDHPEGVAWDDRGYLYIADTGHDRILRVEIGLSTNIPPVFMQTLPGPGGVTISWMGAMGWFYTAQYTDDLMNWTNVNTGIGLPGVDSMMSCTDTNNTGLPLRIYRVVAY